MPGTFAVKPDDRCRHTWSSSALVDEPGSRAQLGPVFHRCGRLEGHPDTHVCSCGALVPRETGDTGASS